MIQMCYHHLEPVLMLLCDVIANYLKGTLIQLVLKRNYDVYGISLWQRFTAPISSKNGNPGMSKSGSIKNSSFVMPSHHEVT